MLKSLYQQSTYIGNVVRSLKLYEPLLPILNHHSPQILLPHKTG